MEKLSREAAVAVQSRHLQVTQKKPPDLRHRKRFISMHEIKWSKREKEVARRAFNAAYQRECRAIATEVSEMMEACKDPQDLWKIEEYLGKARKQIDFKYSYRYSMLIIVLGQLMKQRWLREEDLSGLHDDKTTAIRSIAGRY